MPLRRYLSSLAMHAATIILAHSLTCLLYTTIKMLSYMVVAAGAELAPRHQHFDAVLICLL